MFFNVFSSCYLIPFLAFSFSSSSVAFLFFQISLLFCYIYLRFVIFY